MATAKPDYTGGIVERVRALKDHYLAQCARLDFVAAKKAEIAVLTWAQMAEVCAAASSGADITSYSIGGRSVSKSDIPALRRQLPVLESEMLEALGLGGGVLAGDLRGTCI